MIKYVKLYNEFLGFLKAYSSSGLSEYEKKLLNLILDNFDHIADVGTGHGKRAKLLNEIIQKEGKKASSEISTLDSGHGEKIFPFETLEHIKVCQFRGFSQEETIAFDKRYTFIYGPNGSGKSSLCEALEYSMLGYINEAISKRIDIEKYIRNSVTGRFSYPVLQGITEANKPIIITPDPSIYHFCFIEKSRIENFARISANTPTDKQNLLASLFGLDEFDNFVANFTENIDNYIDVKGVKSELLKQKSEKLSIHGENIDRAIDSLKTIGSEKQDILTDSKLNLSFDSLDSFLHGDSYSKGRINEIEELLNQTIPEEYSVPLTTEIESIFEGIDAVLFSCKEINKEYEDNKDKINFRDLFHSTLQLEPFSKDRCPVCETPISHTVKHPYKNARERLLEFEAIAVLEKKRDDIFNDLDKRIQSLEQTLSKRIETAKRLSLTYSSFDTLSPTNIKNNFDSFANNYNELKEGFLSNKSTYLTFDKETERRNKDIRERRLRKPVLQEEKANLMQISKRIYDVKAKEKTIQENINTWQKVIEDFNKENIELIKDAESEKNIVRENNQYVNAYLSFLARIREYKDDLPIQHLDKLNHLVLELYNTINIHDKTFEKLSSIKLPASTEDSIIISFDEHPEQGHDALHVLSEGHIRCLGLSILLAKNIHDECPIIIFDDVVNAIDDDHRGGVRQLILSDAKFSSKQIILTTHAEGFIKEIEQYFSKSDYDKFVGKMTFLPGSEKRMIRIKYGTIQNYLFKAKQCIENAEWGESLYYCRCSLENISHRLWKILGNKKYKTEFPVVIRAPNAIPDLMSVVSSMNKFLKGIAEHKEYEKTISVFDYLLGLETQSNIIWSYLNKGTHEEEDKKEFDQLIAKEIVENMISLDEAIKGKG